MSTSFAVALLALLPSGSLAFKNSCLLHRGSSHRTSTFTHAEDSSDPYIYLDKWARQQTLRVVFPPEDLLKTVKELRSDPTLGDTYKPSFDRSVKQAESILRDEKRSIGEIIGAGASDRLLNGLEGLEGDAAATRAFLRTPAVEAVVGAVLVQSVLYEGIFEFIQKVDILGNIINGLPILGPMRAQVVQSVKRETDRTLGKQVKSFLGSYSTMATEQVASMVLSQENSAGFAQARRKLGEELLKRPVTSLLPPEATVVELRDSLWALVQLPLPAGDAAVVDRVYELVGDISLCDLDIPPTPEPVSDLMSRALNRFIVSEEGKSFTRASLHQTGKE